MLNVLDFPVKIATNFSIIIFRLKVKYGQFQKQPRMKLDI